MAILIGLRADFYAEALRLPGMATALETGQVLIGPMARKELREAITQPAEQVGLEIEDNLVELLLEDLDADDRSTRSTAALPLLSHALLATWHRSNRARLTLADYRAIGGVRGAVTRSAEDAVAELGPQQEESVRQLFLRLVHVAPDVADTRRRVDRGELLDGADIAVLDQFVRRRLLVVDGETVQIAHEALLGAWPRLQSWIDADRAGITAHRRLTEAARHWRDGHDPDALLRGVRLSAASERFRQPRTPPT
ncbi:nSTAND1 domain-containing NTPase [Pseudonocardia nigra]|uniref:nSTAND1 domain-containing NTPase n=1 Tax=Pseudonocardia nigra TaxID=1921578 RepID=UPI001C5FA9BC|nr:hypothetical protein [Pseudonocardia nigra]